jgi:vacuolar-type H+-ATPase subunit H
MGKNKHRDHRSAGEMVDDTIADVKDFNQEAKSKMDNAANRGRESMNSMENKARNMEGKAREQVDKAKNIPGDMKKKAMDTADSIDKDIADKATSRMDERHS